MSFSIWNKLIRGTDYDRFCSLLSRGLNREAVDLSTRLELSDGQKQVAMAQFANALLRLERYSAPKQAYEKAIEAETSWAARRSKSNSAYLVAYCEYFADPLIHEKKLECPH